MDFFSKKLLRPFAVLGGIHTKQLLMEFFFIFLKSYNLIIIWKKAYNINLLNF